MGLITFLSDFGQRDHYVGAVKAAILSVNPALRVVDLCHEVPTCHIGHAAFVLGAVFDQFATGTVHIAAVGSDTANGEMPVALQLEGHFFVGPNTGLFSLISDKKPTVAVSLDSLLKESTLFVAKNKYAPVAAMLASGKSIYDVGSPGAILQTLLRKQGTIRDNQIQGHVIYVDAAGNLITNLRKQDFTNCLQKNKDQAFEIVLGRERSARLHNSYDDVDGGECFFLFNDQGLLEIGIRYGSAENLLGMGYDTPIYIQFK